MRSNNHAIVTNGVMASNIVSSDIYLDQVFAFGIQAVWTGTPGGTLKVQVSLDIGPDVNGVGSAVVNWTDVAGSSVLLTGAGGNFYWDFPEQSLRWARLVYTAATGAGTLNARANLKGF
jgi:hypothetical protein